ncbi:MAG: hypothetical protein EOP38_12110 [Rubrivivax sp.]|nr:MAG: hypothetical protein EOP38_12110 [Rubrivivax sp.]
MISAHWLHNRLRHKLQTTLLGRTVASVLERKPRSICFCAATRLTEEAFWRESPLGIGLAPLLTQPGITAKIRYCNAEGLPAVYNEVLRHDRSDHLVFLHDDLWLEDTDILEKIRLSLKRFDVVGIAGNTRISRNQPAWLFRAIENYKFVWDHGHLSGSVQHGQRGQGETSVYGPAPANCELLDGVFLAVNRKAVWRSNVRFNETLKFHFYDMDFCRTARRAGMTLGTWPIDLLHLSPGSFGSEAWQNGYRQYRKKWKT